MTGVPPPGRPSLWRLLVWGLQAFLVAAVVRGVLVGRPALTSNAAIGLAVTLLPVVLQRRFGVSVARPLVAWVALAAAFHAAGLVFGLYAPPTRFDLVTHVLSGTVVAAAAVVTVRTWEHHSAAISLPTWFLVAFVLATVMAGGVVWEIAEFAVGDGDAIQTGLSDTMTDLLANCVGGLVTVLVWPPSDPAFAREQPVELAVDSE